MQWFGALILFVTLSAALGLQCHVCPGKTCSNPVTCPPGADRCATVEVNGVFAKTCVASGTCTGNTKCCDVDLCNGAKAPGPTPKPPGPTPKPKSSSNIPTGSGVLLLLASSGIITLFL